MQIVQPEKPVEKIVFDSYGGTLQAMRRTQLLRLCSLHGIEVTKNRDGGPPSKEYVLQDVESWSRRNGVDPLQTPPSLALGAPRGMSVETMLKAIDGPTKMRVPQIMEMGEISNADKFVDMIEGPSDELPNTMPELKKLAKIAGVKQSPTMTADELKAAIRGEDTP